MFNRLFPHLRTTLLRLANNKNEAKELGLEVITKSLDTIYRLKILEIIFDGNILLVRAVAQNELSITFLTRNTNAIEALLT